MEVIIYLHKGLNWEHKNPTSSEEGQKNNGLNNKQRVKTRDFTYGDKETYAGRNLQIESKSRRYSLAQFGGGRDFDDRQP